MCVCVFFMYLQVHCVQTHASRQTDSHKHTFNDWETLEIIHCCFRLWFTKYTFNNFDDTDHKSMNLHQVFERMLEGKHAHCSICLIVINTNTWTLQANAEKKQKWAQSEIQRNPLCIREVLLLPSRTPGSYHGVTMATASGEWLNLITPTG